MVSQFLVLNNRVQEDAAQINQAIYGRVQREIYVLMAALLLVVGVTGLLGSPPIDARSSEVRPAVGELRSLSWKMMRMQEDLQETFSRELHDEFGQLLTAIGMLLGRVKRRLPADSPLVADLDEVRGIVQQTLEQIRTESRMLHPVMLDDFGLEKAIEWYVEQFGRQHGIAARYPKGGPIGVDLARGAIHIYRIVQEALTNVSRHSGSTRGLGAPAAGGRSHRARNRGSRQAACPGSGAPGRVARASGSSACASARS